MGLKTAPEEAADDVLVSHLASYEITSVGPETPLLDVVTALVDGDVGIVTVVEAGVTKGVVSERDIIDAVYDGADLAVVWAADVMQTNLIHIEPESTAAAAGLRMHDKGVRHLLVGDPAVGVVSMRDIVEAFVGSDE